MKKESLAEEWNIEGGGRLFMAPTGAKDIVAVEGSVLGGPNFLPREERVAPILAASLFDAGTSKRTKVVIRDGLSSKGATITFSSFGDRTYFSASCFPEDLAYVLSLIAECLSHAHFPAEEVESEKKRALGNLTEMKSDTRTQAGIAFSQLIYAPSHINYKESLGTTESQVKTVQQVDLKNFRETLGRGGLILALAGDVKPKDARNAVDRAFKKLSSGVPKSTLKVLNTKAPTTAEKLIPIPDKANIDVYLGASLALTKHHHLYHPMILLADMLGGGFTSHLMQTIRERDGLTYGIYASIGALADGADGCFQVLATFSPERYTESVTKLHQELKHFFTKEITEESLARKKDEVNGSYLIGLSTARGIASIVHQIGADGRDLSYLSEYPDIINAVSLKEIQSAANLIPLSKLSLAASGTFPKGVV